MNSVRTFNGVIYTFQSVRDAQKAVTIFIELDDPVDTFVHVYNEFDEKLDAANIEYITGNIA